jgi:hypothetical protein
VSTGDPSYCFEHKVFIWVCERDKHSWETDETHKQRVEQRGQPEHPECPSCTCTTSLTPVPAYGWKW